MGTYNKETGQLECQKCPQFQGKPGVTETLSATSASECKERCPVGQYFDKIGKLYILDTFLQLKILLWKICPQEDACEIPVPK